MTHTIYGEKQLQSIDQNIESYLQKKDAIDCVKTKRAQGAKNQFEKRSE